MDRNFNNGNSLPSFPTRVCRNSAGPADVSLISRAMTISSGAKTIKIKAAQAKSNKRLPRESHQGLAPCLKRKSSAGASQQGRADDMIMSSEKDRGSGERDAGETIRVQSDIGGRNLGASVFFDQVI